MSRAPVSFQFVTLITVVTGPDWASIMTAFGTVAAAVAAVSIALWSDWRLRQHERERDQFTEAYAIQIVNARTSVNEIGGRSDPDDPSMCPLAIVINHGPITPLRRLWRDSVTERGPTSLPGTIIFRVSQRCREN